MSFKRSVELLRSLFICRLRLRSAATKLSLSTNVNLEKNEQNNMFYQHIQWVVNIRHCRFRCTSLLNVCIRHRKQRIISVTDINFFQKRHLLLILDKYALFAQSLNVTNCDIYLRLTVWYVAIHTVIFNQSQKGMHLFFS